MKEIVIDILIALAIAAAGGLFVYRHMEHKLAAAEAQTTLANKATDTVVAASKTAAAVSTHLDQKNAAIARSGASAQASLATAAASDPAWADAPVPADVQAAVAEAAAASEVPQAGPETAPVTDKWGQ